MIYQERQIVMRTKLGVGMLSAAVLIGLCGLGGCGGKPSGDFRTFDAKTDTSPDAEHGHAHDHEHGHGHGPHDGDLVELGDEEYHAEVVFDEESHKVILFLLGADAKSAVSVEAKELSLEMPGPDTPVTHTLAAAPQDGDGEGKSSRFEITSEELIEAFHHDPKAVGKFQVSIGGKEFPGEIKHDHDHDATEKAEK